MCFGRGKSIELMMEYMETILSLSIVVTYFQSFWFLRKEVREGEIYSWIDRWIRIYHDILTSLS